ncbi:MAG: hypothetical protein R3D99_04480 [Altererythrobacter sp.]
MKIVLFGCATAALALSACSTGTTNSFPTPGSYNPLATTQPIDPGMVAIGREVGAIDRSIDSARETGQLTKGEARNARRANSALAGAADRMGADGLSADEQRSLQTQALILSSQIEAAKLVEPPPDKPD